MILKQVISITVLIAMTQNCHAEAKNPNKFIDLTYAFNNMTMSVRGRNSTFYTEIEGFTSKGIWIASKGFCTSEHTSTHIDAPYHVAKDGRKLHDIPLEDLIDVPGVMIDIYDKVHKFKDGSLSVIENYAMTQTDVLEWEAKHGKIPAGAVVFVRTGWASRWGNQNLYLGLKEENETAEESADNFLGTINLAGLNYPAFDVSAARYLAVERQIRGVGIDTLSIDTGSSRTLPAHVLFGSRNIYMLEMVANLHLLPPRNFNVWMMPFKIDFGTGAPTRVLARLNANTSNKENEL